MHCSAATTTTAAATTTTARIGAAAPSIAAVDSWAVGRAMATGYAIPTGHRGSAPGLAVREAAPAYRCADPFEDDADVLDDLEEQIVVLAAHIHAAEHRFLTLIAEFDRRGGWKRAGHRDCADWLQFNTGLRRSTAREKVRVARALERLPLTSRAMAQGKLSFSKVRALARLVDDIGRTEGDGLESAEVERGQETASDEGLEEGAKAANPAEAELLEYAGKCTTAELEKVVRSWRLVNRVDEREMERRRHASRTFSVAPAGDGMYVLRGRLDPEVGAVLMRAVEAASDALFRSGEDWAPEGGRRGPVAREVKPRQRRADALGLLAERALAAGFGAGAGEGGNSDGGDGRGDETPAGERASMASSVKPSGACDRRPPPPVSGTRTERYQVVLHVDEDTLCEDGEGGRSHLEDGTRVSAETARRLSCDAGVVRAVRGGDGSVLDIGRRTRTIPPALRRALEIRDGGCRFPGCGLRFTEGHHVVHWQDGGETKLSNLVLLCRHHHRAVHEDGFRILMRDGRIQFSDRVGWPLPDSPPPSRVGLDAVERLIEENRRRGTDPDWTTPAAIYRRAADIPDELQARAREALDSG